MYLKGDMKGAAAAQMVSQFERVARTKLDFLSPQESEVSLYQANDKLVAALSNDGVVWRVEVPITKSDDVRISRTFKDTGSAISLSEDGKLTSMFGAWGEGKDGEGFYGDDAMTLTDLTRREATKEQRSEAFSLARALVWSFD